MAPAGAIQPRVPTLTGASAVRPHLVSTRAAATGPEAAPREAGLCTGAEGADSHAHPKPRCSLGSARASPPTGEEESEAVWTPGQVSRSKGNPRTPGEGARPTPPPALPTAVTMTSTALSGTSGTRSQEQTWQSLLSHKDGPSTHGGPRNVPKDRRTDRSQAVTLSTPCAVSLPGHHECHCHSALIAEPRTRALPQRGEWGERIVGWKRPGSPTHSDGGAGPSPGPPLPRWPPTLPDTRLCAAYRAHCPEVQHRHHSRTRGGPCAVRWALPEPSTANHATVPARLAQLNRNRAGHRQKWRVDPQHCQTWVSSPCTSYTPAGGPRHQHDQF